VKIWVIVPAYNEEQSLAGLLQEVKKEGVSVLAIDDGSIDNTHIVAEKWADIALHNIKNLGKGISLRKAISHLLQETDFDYIITMDGDGQHSVDDLPKFLQAARDGAFFVVGNRMEDPKGMPKTRIVTNRFMSWLISKISQQSIPDSQCGYRLIKREILEKIIIKTKKYEIESEMLIKAARLNYNIQSIPIKSIYFKNLRSKINPFVDTVRFIRFLYRLHNARF